MSTTQTKDFWQWKLEIVNQRQISWVYHIQN